MIIPIHLPTPGSSSSNTLPPQFAQFGTDEVVLIELQGSLEVEGDKANQRVGKLSIDSTTKKSTLLIGHNLLEGKLVNLPKPLAVLHRNSSKYSSEQLENMDEDVEMDSKTKSEQKGWDVATVVRRKMVFAKRPMPMVGHAAPGAVVSSVEKAN
ncbi:hypothetical protein ABKN59_011499 [Abortiporus biennis]